MNGNTLRIIGTSGTRGIAIAAAIVSLSTGPFVRDAVAAFPYSSGSGGSGKVCQNATYISCTTDADCVSVGGSCIDNTGYSYPWYMNGYSTLIFDFGQPVDDLPPPILTYDESQQRVCLSGKVIGFRSDDPSVLVVYDIRSNNNPDDLFTDPSSLNGPLGMCYYGVQKDPVAVTPSDPTQVPLCDGTYCTQTRYAYTVKLYELAINDMIYPDSALNGVLVFNDADSIALGRGSSGECIGDDPGEVYTPGVSKGLPCKVQVGFNSDCLTKADASCQFQTPATLSTPFGFDVSQYEALHFEEQCVKTNVEDGDDPLNLVGTIFEDRGYWEGCDGLGLVTRMCNDAGTAAPSCTGQQQGWISAQTGDELSIEEHPLLVCVGPTIEDLLAKLSLYNDGTPIVIYPCADNTEGKIEAPTVFTRTTAVFSESEGDTTLDNLNIVGVGTPFTTTNLFTEVANKNVAVWDFSDMAMIVNVIDSLELVDTIKGSPGDDLILGGNGDDDIDGYLGNDTLWGQGNDDKLTGGEGDDCFVLDDKLGKETITDFGGGDVLVNISKTNATIDTSVTPCRVYLKGQNWVDVNGDCPDADDIKTSFEGLSCPALP